MSIERALQSLRNDSKLSRHFTAWETQPSSQAHFAPFPPGLAEGLPVALAQRGIHALYTHQALAVAAALRGLALDRIAD